MFHTRGNQWWIRGSALLVGSAALVLYGAAIWFGNLNQDEGWYLQAARLVAQGRQPYRDFFFTQGPVMPYVYALLAPLWSAWGVLGGRIITAGMGLLSALLAGALARRSVPLPRATEAGILAFTFTAGNLYHVYFTTIPKTYALSACLLLGGYLVLTLCYSRRKRTRSFMSTMWALPAGVLIALAAGVRLSLGLLLPLTTLSLLVSWRKSGGAFFWFALGGGLGLALVFGPIMLQVPEQFVFSQTFHVQRGGQDLLFMAGSVARLACAYLPVFLAGFGALIFRLFMGYRRVAPRESGTLGYHGASWSWQWLWAFAGVFILQLFTPFPYDDYQVPIMGLLAAAVTGWIINSTSSGGLRSAFLSFWVVGSLLSSFGSPLAQEWFVARQDRFWVVPKKVPDLALLRSVARDVKALSEGDEVLLTQDLYLAVESGQRVPTGFEMGPFAYFPELSDAEAQKYRVLNREGLESVLAAAPATVAAYSGYGFAIQAPVMDRVPEDQRCYLLSLLGRNYDSVQEVVGFGQNGTTLQIMSRRRVSNERKEEQ